MQEQTIADKRIKTIGIFMLFSSVYFMQNHKYVHWFLLLAGPAYLYFSILKYKADKVAGTSADKALSLIIMGGVVTAIGIVMTILTTVE